MPRKRPQPRKPDLTIVQILSWADDFNRRTGRWPRHSDGRVPLRDESWLAINVALGRGNRGLPGGSSLANLLYTHRGVRNPKNLPPLKVQQILRWARSHFHRTGEWPYRHDGAILDAPGETWYGIDNALRKGIRKLRGGSSLSNLLAASGIKHNIKQLPPLRPEQILRWADAYFRRHRSWPSVSSGQVVESHLESWSGIDGALRFGRRGLPGGSSLPQFLNEHRGLFEGRSRRPKQIQESERLRLEDIVAWAKDYRRRTGDWPNRASGRVRSRRSLTWLAIDSALKKGCRGLEGGSSLARLFRANSGRQ